MKAKVEAQATPGRFSLSSFMCYLSSRLCTRGQPRRSRDGRCRSLEPTRQRRTGPRTHRPECSGNRDGYLTRDFLARLEHFGRRERGADPRGRNLRAAAVVVVPLPEGQRCRYVARAVEGDREGG